MQIYCHKQLHAVTREKLQPPLVVMPTGDLLDIFLLSYPQEMVKFVISAIKMSWMKE